MPSDMRLQCPSEDTPPSTRPPSVASSAASTSGTPHRSTSMDSLHTNSSSSEKPSGEEYIPTRLIRPTPKVNANAMQFVKTGPANLHRSAKEQMKKVEVVKSLRKTSLQEEEEWQSNSTTMKSNSLEDGSDWQMNLDKWKSSRRKRNEDVLERVIEVKKNELDEEFSKTRRKSKTFSEMREDKTKRGRRYNLVVHDDDNNDLSDLGISTAKNGQSLSDAPEEGEAKSDAGFCTGSDTGSDGVFAEDNISDTSSALGDKREIHDSLLDSGSPPNTQKSSEVLLNGHHVNGTSVVTDTSISTCSVMSDEYTYDKAIEDYKQFAENSVKKRTSSVTSLSSNASGSKEEQEKSSSGKMSDDRFSSYDGGTREPKVIRRDRTAAKVDIGKRRSMFELREIDQQESQKADLRRSMDVSSKLRSKVASFENVNDSDSRTPTVKPVRDTKFKEKLESFSKKERFDNSSLSQRKTPERDQNFYQKLQNFTQMEAKTSMEILERKTSPERKHLRKSFDRKISPTRKSSDKIYDKRTPPPMPLKERIASFENLSPTSSPGKKELSISMENLNNKFTYSDESRVIQSSQSVTNLFRRTPSTPFMVVEVDEEMEEKACVKRNVTRVSSNDGPRVERDLAKRLTVYEEIEKVVIQRDVSNAPLYSIFKEDYEMNSSVHETLEKEKSTRTSLEKQSYEAPPLPEKTRPRSHIGITSRTLPEVPVSKPARTLPEPPNIVSVSRAIPDTTKEVVCTKSPSESRTARTLPAVPKPQVPDISEPRIPAHSEVLPQVPPKEPEMILNWLPETSFSEDSHELSTRVPDVAPPPVPPPRVPTIEDPYTSLSSFTTTEDSKDYTYGDQDIDEVINNEISLESISSTNRGTFHENGYEKSPEIKMFEKVTETNENYTNGLEESHSHRHHQSSAEENFSLKAGRSPSPPLPPKNKNLAVFEVLDVTWTENNYSSPAAPPSVPPPPPPPEEEEEEDSTQVDGVPLTSNPSDKEGPRVKTSENSSTKQDLRKLRSNFLGTNPQVEEVVTLQPPPDLTELLRQERDAERLLVQKQANLKRESPMMDFEHSSGMSLTGRSKYTWEDRMKADGPSTERHFNDDSVDPFEFHTPYSKLSTSVHALNSYQNYVSKFSVSPFVHNFRNDPTAIASDANSNDETDINKVNDKSLVGRFKNGSTRVLSCDTDVSMLSENSEQSQNEFSVLHECKVFPDSTGNDVFQDRIRRDEVKGSNTKGKGSDEESRENEFKLQQKSTREQSTTCVSQSQIASLTDEIRSRASRGNFSTGRHKENSSKRTSQEKVINCESRGQTINRDTEEMIPNRDSQETSVNIEFEEKNMNRVSHEKTKKRDSLVKNDINEKVINRVVQDSSINSAVKGNSTDSVKVINRVTQETTSDSVPTVSSFQSPQEKPILSIKRKTDIKKPITPVKTKVFISSTHRKQNEVKQSKSGSKTSAKDMRNGVADLKGAESNIGSIKALKESGKPSTKVSGNEKIGLYHKVVKIPKLEAQNRVSSTKVNVSSNTRNYAADTANSAVGITYKDPISFSDILRKNIEPNKDFSINKQTRLVSTDNFLKNKRSSKCKYQGVNDANLNIDYHPGSNLAKNKSKSVSNLIKEHNSESIEDCSSLRKSPKLNSYRKKSSELHKKSAALVPPQNLGKSKSLSKSVDSLNKHEEKQPKDTVQYILIKSKAKSLNPHITILPSKKYGSNLRRSNSRSESNLLMLPNVPSTLPKSLDNLNNLPSKSSQSLENLYCNQEVIKSDSSTLFPDVPISLPLILNGTKANKNVLSDTVSALLDTISVLLDDATSSSTERYPYNSYLPHSLSPNPTSHFHANLNLHASRGSQDSIHPSMKNTQSDAKLKQLAELEQEMEKHDRDMLQRLKPPSIPETKEMYIDDTSEPIAQPSHYPDKLSSSREPEHYQEFNNSSNRNNQSIAKSSSTENSHTPVQEFYSAPVYKNEPTELNFNSRIKTSQENLYSDPPSVSREIKRVVEPSKSLPDVPPPVPRKQSILALSAIPKPKLTDNDSWIMKKKAEGTKKDYSKHWLIQEAEQRRLEQQERITRPMQLPINKQVNTLHTTQGFQNHFQNLKTSFHISPYNQSSGTNNATISNASNTLYNPPSPSNNYNNNSPSNTTSCPPPNNNWMKQTKTYQPQQPASPTAANNKPLPDAIISSITQRVNNKMNGRTPVYNSAHNNNSVRTEDNYHDYMNTGAFNSTYSSSGNSTSNTSPVSASSGGTPQGSHISTHLPSLSSQQGISGSQQGTLSDDQRLLSVSGKKKCSHCSEELGRGAAMIIESLRLFYHIPCFKCCVCGIQLGNGTSGADVRVRNHKLHCHNCYSNDEGMKFSKV